MAKYIAVGIGDRFSYNRRRWTVYDIRDGIFYCKTRDNDKKPELNKTFETNEIEKLCK